MPVMRFDEERHKYYVDGVEYPGVTTVLSAMGLSDNQWFKDRHRRRGTAVHDIAGLLNEVVVRDPRPFIGSPEDIIAQSRWDIDNTHPDLVRRGIAYAKFLFRSGFRPAYVETPVFSTLVQLAGTLDAWGTLDGYHGTGTVLLDIKSGEPAPCAKIQIALYDHLLHACMPQVPPTEKMFALQLKDNEDYRVHPLAANKYHLALGLNAVSLYHWRKNHNLLPKQNGDDNGKQSPFGA